MRVHAPGAATYMLVETVPFARPAIHLSDPDSLLRSVLTEYNGKIEGELQPEHPLCLVFATPDDAVRAEPAVRGALASAVGGPAGLRIAIGGAPGTSQAEWAPSELLEQTALLLPLAHGGQTLLIAETAASLAAALPPACELRPLGTYRLPDLRTTQEVVQLCRSGEPEWPALPSLDNLPNNLSIQLTTFVGRQSGIRTVQSLVRHNRLVTLTGAGGSGKTRLALQVGASLLPEFPDGVWFVDLSGLSDPNLVTSTVLATLRVADQKGRPALDSLTQALAHRRMLILLDNCEHLVTSCAHLLIKLLPTCPQVTVLATSREPLGVPGEVLWSVPALQQPDAVRLFVERARASNPSFAVTERNSEALGALCSSLDGIPLAIELAAARTRILSVEQILQRLSDRLQLLTGGRRTTLARHQTLRASVDWSYDLLEPAEQRLFLRLAIFAGSFTLEAAEAVCGIDGLEKADILELLSQLVDKSLVMTRENQGSKRFWLLETMRQYGRSRWEAGEEERFARAHCDWYVHLAEQGDSQLTDSASRIEEFSLERDNFRQAIQWALEAKEFDQAFRLCGRLYTFWMRRGYASEAWARLAPLAKMADPSVSVGVRARVIHGAGALAFYRGELDLALGYLHQALDLFNQAGDLNSPAVTLNTLGMVYHEQGNIDLAIQYVERALAVSKSRNLPPRAMISRANLGALYYHQGDNQRAREHVEASLAELEQAGPERESALCFAYYLIGAIGIEDGEFEKAETYLNELLSRTRPIKDYLAAGHALAALGELAIHRHQHHEARSLLVESLQFVGRAGDLTAVPMVIESLAWLATLEGAPHLALRLAGGLATLRRWMGAHVSAQRTLRFEQRIAPAWQALAADGPVAFAAGEALSTEALIELACAPVELPVAAKARAGEVAVVAEIPSVLTPREQEIIRLLGAGLTAREIGQRLYLSPRTVEKHEENIRHKLDVPNRAALVAWAAQRGLT